MNSTLNSDMARPGCIQMPLAEFGGHFENGTIVTTIRNVWEFFFFPIKAKAGGILTENQS